MKKKYLIIIATLSTLILSIAFKNNNTGNYQVYCKDQLNRFNSHQLNLAEEIKTNPLKSDKDFQNVKTQLNVVRTHLKKIDFWLRYLEPIVYKKINGPLPVEWETEVFEKFEKPYKREAAGLTLASLYLDEENLKKDSLLKLVTLSIKATDVYLADSIQVKLTSYHHFFLCNRLFLLNLATIYTTGFECPDTSLIIPELRILLTATGEHYLRYNESFNDFPISKEYLTLYSKLQNYVVSQSNNYSEFDHFTFLREYVNPLFTLNQSFIKDYKVVTSSTLDYSLNKDATSIFSKSLFNAQFPKGIFLRVKEEEALAEINQVGKLLFYDPILSGNNLRSCVSCHKPTQYFTDTLTSTSLQFDRKNTLPRNSPSLLNVQYNHLLMVDGKHISLQAQTKDVITNPIEMGGNEKEVLNKILSCKAYKTTFTKLLKYTPQEKEITIDHIASAITFYYSKFSAYSAPFDEAMNKKSEVTKEVQQGFNLFMSKAQCATCHFAPIFNGVKPPYTNSEFEVIGVPEDKEFKKLSSDIGRHGIHAAQETHHAFRTGTIRNSHYTNPYMHNGVFTSLEEVVNFYNEGGGSGKGLNVENQTLSSDSLKLSKQEIKKLLIFIESLNETIHFEEPPTALPSSKIESLNTRKVGGEY